MNKAMSVADAGSFPKATSRPLIGRRKELAGLLAGIETDLAGAVPGLTCIWAPAGAGKTRMVNEASRTSDAEFLLLNADGSPDTDPFTTLVRSWFGTAGSGDLTRDGEVFDSLWDGLLLRLEMEGGIMGRLRDELRRTRKYIRDIAVHPDGGSHSGDPAVIAAGRRASITAFVSALAVTQPSSVVIVAENVQWFTAEQVDTLSELMQVSVGLPVSFIATSRPGDCGDPPVFPTSSSLGRVETIELEGLPRESLPGLVNALIGLTPDRDLADWLWDSTAGIPLFVEHALYHLTESGSAEVKEGSLRLTGALPPIEDSAASLLTRRLDSLPEAIRYLLRAASVLGTCFPMEQLAELTGTDAVPLISEAVDRRILVVSGEFLSFTHELLRETALESCPPKEASRLHLAAAVMLAGSGGKSSPGLMERIGTHFHLGGDPESASGYLLAAAEGYSAVFDNDSAQSMYTRAAVLLGEPERTQAELALADVQRNAGMMNRTVELLTGTLSRIAGHPEVDRILQARVAMGLGMSLASVGRLAEGRELLEGTLEVFREAEETAHTATALRHLGMTSLSEGRSEDAIGQLDAALGLSREMGDPGSVCSSLYWYAIACRETGRMDRFRTLTLEQVSLAEESGPVQSLIGGYDNLMRVHIQFGDFQAAEAVHGKLVEAAESCGNWAALSAASSKMGIIHLKRGEWEKARDRFLRCVVLTGRTGNLRARCAALGNLAHAAIEMEDLDTAMDHTTTMIDTAASIGFRLCVMAGYARMSYIFSLRSAFEPALDCAETQIEMARAIGEPRNLSDGHATLARILLATGRPVEALDSAEEALRISTEAGDDRLRSGQLELKGKLLVLLGRPDEALPLLEDCLSLVQGKRGRENVVLAASTYLEAAQADLGDRDAPDRLLSLAVSSPDDAARMEVMFQHWRVTGSKSSEEGARELILRENRRKPRPLMQIWLDTLNGVDH